VAKYKAKAATDTFFQRFGDFGSALLVLLGTQLAFSVEKFAAVNVILVAVWIVIALATGRGFARLMAKEGRPATAPQAAEARA
jgi:ATP/ADP translocase